MNLKRYSYIARDNFQRFEFQSEGPKGSIKKLVRFAKIRDGLPGIYNLAFGDRTAGSNDIDDSVITNNADTAVVLATVASTVNDFCTHHGNHYVFAAGSTPSRTRLYQIGIAGIWTQIILDFDLSGLREGRWAQFKPNVNYDAFLVKKK